MASYFDSNDTGADDGDHCAIHQHVSFYEDQAKGAYSLFRILTTFVSAFEPLKVFPVPSKQRMSLLGSFAGPVVELGIAISY